MVALGALAMKASADIGGAYRSIQRETGATGKELTGLKTAFDTVFKTVPASADDVATALSRITQTLDLTTSASGVLATQFLNLSRMTGTDLTTNINSASEAFNAWGDKIPDVGFALDALYTISQNTGQSVNDISSTLALAAGPAMAAGLGYQETAIMVAQLGQSGVPTKQVISSLTAVVKDATANNVSASTEWQNLINKFKDPAYKATADDMAILGTNTTKFANAARSGDLDYGPLLQKIKDSPNAINDMAEKTGTLGDALTLLKNRGSLALKPLGDSIFGVAKDIVKNMDPAMTVVEGLGKAFDKLPEPVKKATVVLGALAASSGPVLTIGGQLGSMLGPIIMNFGALLPVLLAVGIPLVAIGAALGVLAVGLGIAYTASATFRGVLGTVATALGTFGGSITKAITQLTGGDFQGALDTVRAALNQLVVDLSTIDWSSVGDKIQQEIANAFSDQSSTLNKIADQLHKMIDAVPWGQLGQELGQGLGEMFAIGLGALTGTGTASPSKGKLEGASVTGTSLATSTVAAPSAGGVTGLEDAGRTAAGSFTGGFQKGLEEGMSDINWGAVIAALWNGLYALGPQTMGEGKTVFNITADDIGYPTAAEVGQSIKNWIGSVWDNVVLGNKAILKVVFDVPVIGPVLQAAWDFLKFIFSHFSTYTAILNIQVLADDVTKIFNTLKDWVGKQLNIIVNFLKGVGQELWNMLSSGASKAVSVVINAVTNAAAVVAGAVSGGFNTLIRATTNAIAVLTGAVGGGFNTFIRAATDAASVVAGAVVGGFNTFIRAATDAASVVGGAVAGGFNTFIRVTTDAASVLQGAFSGITLHGHVPAIPLVLPNGADFAEGGIFDKPTFGRFAEAGREMIVPEKFFGMVAPSLFNILPNPSGYTPPPTTTRGSSMSIPSVGGRGPTSSVSSAGPTYIANITVDSENLKRKVMSAFREMEQYHHLY